MVEADRAAARKTLQHPTSSADERLRQAHDEARGCRACPLWRGATQVVFGEGPARARMMLVGEQPGDQEDRAGHPFVGPAGRVLDRALDRAGIDRGTVYVTNGVKHFKYRARGKRRIHQRPAVGEVQACLRWLAAELEIVAPEVVVALGAVAARSLIGRPVAIGGNRGRPLESPLLAAPVVVTAHPASVLRMRDEDGRRAAFDGIAADIAAAARL